MVSPMRPVTDPNLLAQLNSNSGKPVTDQNLLVQLNGSNQPTSPGFLDSALPIANTVNKALNYGTTAPLPGEGRSGILKTMSDVQGGFDKAGGYVAEKLGEAFPNHPYLAAGAGQLIQNANPLNWIGPKGGIPETKIYEPNIPPERAPIVAAAEAKGLTPTLADKTGSRTLAGVENKLSRTPMGHGPLSDVYGVNAKAIETNKAALLSKYGTDAEPSVIGSNVEQAINANKKPLREMKNQAFQNVYDNVNVPIPEAEKTAMKFIQEQDKAPSGYGNPELRTKAEGILDIKNKVSNGENVNTGEGYYGTPDNKVGYKASPPEQFKTKPNYEQIKIVREGLNGLIQKETSPSGEVSPTGQKYIALKSSLDKDISNFAKQSTGNPLADLEAQQFAETYNSANKISSDYASKFKNPAVNDFLSLARKGKPELIVDALFRPKNNVSTINRIKSAAGPEAFGLAKKAFVTDLLNKKNIGLELAKYEPETLKAIFTPDELSALKEHGDISNLNMTAERPGMGANKSESGTLATHSLQYGGLLTGLAESARTLNPIPAIAGIGQFVAPRYLAKGYIAARNGVSLGGARPPIANAGTAGALSGLSDSQRQAILEEYVRRHGAGK